ncbi:cation-transporting P-type ATPase [Desulforamulus ruminis]|uniref:P-type ATPase n=1 Tax=Desulforamulus ruminis TaxID=1564 RepID=UPI001EE41392|nr:cation-transporting P-type ATPase [Desulforamulus ruminis]
MAIYKGSKKGTQVKAMHILPGRIRIRFPVLKKNPWLAEDLNAYLSSLPGVASVQISSLTGSCLIYFTGKTSAQELEKAIQKYLEEYSVIPRNKPKGQKGKPQPPVHAGLKQVLAGGAILTLFWGLPPTGTTMPRSLSLPVSSAAVITTGYPVFKSALGYFGQHKKPNYEFVLGLVSLVSTLTGRGYLGLLTMWLATLGSYLQKQILRTASYSFSNILMNKGTRIALWEEGRIRPVLPGDILPGDVTLFKAGDCIQVEGEVLSGRAKGLPNEEFHAGQQLEAGAHLTEGQLLVKVHRVVEDTSLARLADILDDAVEKPETGNHLAISYAERLLPVTLFTTLLVFLLTRNFQRTASVLLAGAPGPAGLAAPTALSAATGMAAGMGIAVKDPMALEALSHVDLVIFDEQLSLEAGKLPLLIKALEEEGYKVEDFDPRHIHEDASFNRTTKKELFALSTVEKLHQRGLRVAWISGPEKPVFIKNADVNILFLTGREKQLSRAQIICYKNDPRQVYRVIDLSRQTLHTIQQNVFMVQGINLLGQTLGALGIIGSVPALGMNLLSTLMVVLHSGHSLLGMPYYKPPARSKGTIQGLMVDKGKCFAGGKERMAKE